MIDEATASELGRQWDEGWNRGDVDTIMAPFAPDVVFNSPFVTRLTGDAAKTTIDGYDALRTYVTDALERAPGIRYTVHATYAGTETMVLVYTVHRADGTDKPGADTMRVDADGKVVEWRCHYSFDFIDAPLAADLPT
jgi:ketosteroid isomerase-like protein